MPRRWPIAIILIFIFTSIYSILFFPKVNELRADSRKHAEELRKITVQVMAEACRVKAPNSSICDGLDEKSIDRMPTNTEVETKSESEGKAESSTEAQPEEDDLDGKTPLERLLRDTKPSEIERVLNKDFDEKKDLRLKEIYEQVVLLQKLFTDMQKDPEDHPDYIKNTPSYPKFLETKKRVIDEIARQYSEKGLTSAQNRSISALLKSTFTHADYGHLIGNLILFLILGMWVEQRVGTVAVLGTFMGGSLFGLGLHTFTSELPVLGASAGVSAIMGAFFVFFFKAQVRFLLVLFPFYFKRIYLSAYWTFPVFYFIHDLIGAANLNSSGVAHSAHLGGLFFGLVYAMVDRKLHPMQSNQLFEEEGPLLRKLEHAATGEDAVNSYIELSRWNPQNWKGALLFLKKMNEHPMEISQLLIKERVQKQLKLTANFIFNKRPQWVNDFVKNIPGDLFDYSLFKEINEKKIIRLADSAGKVGAYKAAYRLYSTAFDRPLDERVRAQIHPTLQFLKKQIQSDTDSSNPSGDM